MPNLTIDLVLRRGGFLLDVRAEFRDGITAIFGPSGSGKTTTLSCIAGLLKPERGEIAIRGRPLFSSERGVDLPPERRRVGFVFQDGALFPHLSVIENVRYGYRLTAPNDRRIDVDHVVGLLGLTELRDRSVDSLSGGERQRVALARALAVSPQLLLLDEPIASLDARLRGVVLSYLRQVHRELGVPMVYVSHDLSEVLALAQAVLILRSGRSAGFGRPSRVLLSASAGALHGGESVENLLDGVVLEPGGHGVPARVRVGDAEFVTPAVDRPPGSPVVVSIGAGDIIVAAERPSRLSARNVLPGVCVELQEAGDRVFLRVEIGTEMLVEVTPGAVAELGLKSGRDVHLVFKTSSIAVMDAGTGVAPQ